MELSIFLEQILFVIVLYKRKPEESPALAAIDALRTKVNKAISVFIYDNSPVPCSFVNAPDYMYRHDADNSGVSKAYNESAHRGKELKKKWMMLLDQDTYLNELYIEGLAKTVERNSDTVAFVPVLVDAYSAVSPFRWSLGRGIRIDITHGKLSLRKFRFLNSGLFIQRAAFQRAGGYPETIPLYFSDIAFGERLSTITDHFMVIPTRIRHSLSASEKIHKDAALHRYHYFCLGAFAMGEAFRAYGLYYSRALLRGLKLSFVYRDLGFLKTFYRAAKW